MTRSGALALIRAGADDVMSAAPDANDVIRALAKASARATDDVKTGEEGGETVKTLAFLHASGGAGATTLAVNGALLLAERVKKENGRVALIDLDAQFGDADLHMDLRERSRLLEILKAPERLDHRMLEDLMVDGPKGIRVLTVGEAPLPLDAFSPQTIETILAIARKQYRYVVVDMPLALTQWTDAALQRVDHAFIVTQASVPALNSARRLIQALKDENALAAPATVLLNRYGGKGQSPKITLEQAAKSLDQPIRFTLPSDYSLLSDSIDQGVPAALQRSASKFCESLGAALDSVVEHKGVAAATSPVRKVFKFGR
jgi:pilus assembly protein CpaE